MRLINLFKPTNIAIARGLRVAGFQDRLDMALQLQTEMQATVVWGSESELAVDGIMKTMTDRLGRIHGGDRVRPVRLLNQKHALANDIHLQAAIVLEGLKETA